MIDARVLFLLLLWSRCDAKLREGVRVSEAGCWEWTRSGDGRYGHVYLFGERFKSHVASAILYHGLILRKRVWRHRCDNKACCNPEHLEPGTQAENCWDASERGRRNNGLPKRTVTRIRLLLSRGHTQAEVQRRVGVHSSTVSRIANGKMR